MPNVKALEFHRRDVRPSQSWPRRDFAAAQVPAAAKVLPLLLHPYVCMSVCMPACLCWRSLARRIPRPERARHCRLNPPNTAHHPGVPLTPPPSYLRIKTEFNTTRYSNTRRNAFCFCAVPIFFFRQPRSQPRQRPHPPNLPRNAFEDAVQKPSPVTPPPTLTLAVQFQSLVQLHIIRFVRRFSKTGDVGSTSGHKRRDSRYYLLSPNGSQTRSMTGASPFGTHCSLQQTLFHTPSSS